MDVRKPLLKSLKESLTITACSDTTTNASHRYPRGRDQNEYKFTIHQRY